MSNADGTRVRACLEQDQAAPIPVLEKVSVLLILSAGLLGYELGLLHQSATQGVAMEQVAAIWRHKITSAGAHCRTA
ncbi:MAG: hypothetical protein C0607_20780 [Azoarcus sp.]|nr:MAG: hypothetical protein C0607_20780 [Azoarcus sp.]TVT53070.1 MAG: hypothetical protein FHK80_19635 [Azoarcus sp. PHD]